ncbi:MAG: prephenate dehydrogenase/arogenate dehydrogenase family protein [Candidatus Marinimicrobia bacterium]|nr:prephenate dehydrogenase/arogenate dehydrogenase family protein [Candidatus Neomarinimicrobiota bacterium]
MNQKKSTIGIIGYGRFGVLLAELLSKDFQLVINDVHDLAESVESAGYIWQDLKSVMEQDTVFLAVPISSMPPLLEQIVSLTHTDQLFVDVASVKTSIRDWMVETLPASVQILNTHPMFGPDSYKRDRDLRMVFCPSRIPREKADLWRKIFESWGCRLIDLSVEEHDRQAARSQGITHFMGRVMKGMDIQPTAVDTHGFRQVHHVVEQTCQDTEELFHDLQFYNPYTAEMLTDFSRSVHAVKARIYRPDSPPEIIGYQGIPGSFSEEATLNYITDKKLGDIETKPCLSSQEVMVKLATFEIDRGIIAMENARGGVVHESIHALAKARCRVRTMFHIQVNQCLIMQPGVTIDQITEVRSHPQALKQCLKYLEANFASIPQIEAEDTAEAARKLQAGDYSHTTAVIAPARAAAIYGLTVNKWGIQDLKDNQTLFLVVERTGTSI